MLYGRPMRSVCLVSLVALAGCSLYWDEDNDGTPDAGECVLDGGSQGSVFLRNPDTLQCVDFGGGSRPCVPGCPCENLKPDDTADQAPAPSWGVCGGPCDSLGEAECLGAFECRAAYDRDCFLGTGPCTALQPFLGCFALSQQFSSGVCEGLDSWSCSSRSDCIALHQQVCDAPGSCWPQFFECVSENR